MLASTRQAKASRFTASCDANMVCRQPPPEKCDENACAKEPNPPRVTPPEPESDDVPDDEWLEEVSLL